MNAENASTTILNIDDDDAKRYTVTRILQRSGFKVVEAVNGKNGLDQVVTSPDLIVLDVRLPDINGLEICRILKSNEATSTIPVMLLSASLTESMHRAQGLDFGADSYVIYPVEAHELVATVHSLLRLSRAESRARTAAAEWHGTFEAITDGICLVDRTHRIVRANKALAELFALPLPEIIGCEIGELIADRQGNAQALLRRFGQQADERIAFELPMKGRIFEMAADPIGTMGGRVLIFSDITARRQLEIELAASYEQDRRIAETLQRSFLIDIPDHAYPKLSTARFYEPAWTDASVGGDYYDSFALADGHIVLVVGDATGKGLAAATRTTEVKYALRAFVHEHRDPGLVLGRLNDFLCEMHESDSGDGDIAVALALAIVAPDAARLHLAAAGAEPPLVLRANGEADIVSGGGLPLGVFRGHTYESHTVDFLAGDALILVTDGVTEARRGNEFLGYEGFIELARQNSHQNETHAFGQAIVDGARGFAGGMFKDDVCLLIARHR